VAQFAHNLIAGPIKPINLGLPLADLAVTGRRAFGDFVLRRHREGGAVEAAAMAELTEPRRNHALTKCPESGR
jgi:hypothetical protein